VGYCLVADVQHLRPQITFAAGTKPSTADVQTAIDQVSDHINGIIGGLGITVPLNSQTSPISYGYIRACVMWGVAGLLEDAQRAAISGNPGSQQVKNDYHDQYLACIEAITEKPGILVDAIPSTDAAAQRNIASFFTHNPSGDVENGLTSQLTAHDTLPRFNMRQSF
jgi:hypothetical protein